MGHLLHLLEARLPLSQGGATLQACDRFPLLGQVSLGMCLLELGLPDQQLQFVGIVPIYLLQDLVSLLRIDLIKTL